MLNQVRNALKGIVAYFVVALLILAFAAWQVPDVRNFVQRPPLKVGDRGFSSQDILTDFNREVTSRRVSSENGYTREDAIAEGLPSQLIEQIATRTALEEQARDLGLAMPRDVVSDFLQNDERYHNPRTGKFDNEVLTSILTAYNLSPQAFADVMQKDLLRNQLIGSITSGPIAPEYMAGQLLLRQVEHRQVTYLTITDEMAGIAEEPTPEALKDFYDQNAVRFTAPEYRTFSTLILKASDFADAETTSDEALKEFYDANKARLYERPERRSVFQITYDTETAAISAAARAEQGTDFASLAEERGLPLDAITFDDIVQDEILDPSVGEAVFAGDVAENGVVGPVRSLLGYTVAKVTSITPPETQSFEDVRDQIKEQLASGEERRRMFEAVEAVEVARDTGASLADAATEQELTITEYGPVDSFSFGKGGEIIDGIPGDVLNEAFSLEEGEESQAIELEDESGYFFVFVNAITPPSVLPMKDVADEVEAGWRAQERERRLDNTLTQVRQEIDGGASMASAAKQFNRAALSEKIRRASNPDFLTPSLLEQVFAAETGDLVSGPTSTGRVVVRVNEIEFDREAGGTPQIASTQQFLGFQLDQELLEAYASTAREEVGVQIDSAAIDRIFSDAP
ncbi:MAG: peptidyl-prolyl cis-trans isomerase [Pseudomonadota bacterium]